MNSVAIFLISFLLIGASIWTLFTSSMFLYSLAGKDPMDAKKNYLGNVAACALPLTTSTLTLLVISYIWWAASTV